VDEDDEVSLDPAYGPAAVFDTDHRAGMEDEWEA
jgi:hypothetical protein